MSAADQAFIRAYAKEAKTASAGSPRPDVSDAPAEPSTPQAVNPPHAHFASVHFTPTETSSEAVSVNETLPISPPDAFKPPSVLSPPKPQWRIDARHLETPGNSTNLPLSAYATPAPVEPTFRPAYEVDRFVWPAACDTLLELAGESFQQLAESLLDGARRHDRKVIAMTGCRRNEGRSHLLLTLAKVLAERRIKAVVVDGDFQKGQLARQLGLSVRVGFDDVLAGESELIDVLVESLKDGLSLLPLHERLFDGVELRDKLRMTVAFGILRDHYDLVLVDAGPAEKLDSPRVHCFTPGTGLDGAILVRDLRNTTDDDVALAERLLTERGITCLGIAENFVRT